MAVIPPTFDRCRNGVPALRTAIRRRAEVVSAGGALGSVITCYKSHGREAESKKSCWNSNEHRVGYPQHEMIRIQVVNGIEAHFGERESVR